MIYINYLQSIFLFPEFILELKMQLKSQQFVDISAIQHSLMKKLNIVTAEDISVATNKLHGHAKLCIDVKRIYFK